MTNTEFITRISAIPRRYEPLSLKRLDASIIYYNSGKFKWLPLTPDVLLFNFGIKAAQKIRKKDTWKKRWNASRQRF